LKGRERVIRGGGSKHWKKPLFGPMKDGDYFTWHLSDRRKAEPEKLSGFRLVRSSGKIESSESDTHLQNSTESPDDDEQIIIK